MDQERITTLVRAFSTTRRSEIYAAWRVAESMGDDLLALLAEAFPQVRKAEGRASILRYVGRFSRESEFAFTMGISAVRDRAYADRHYAIGSVPASPQSRRACFYPPLCRKILPRERVRLYDGNLCRPRSSLCSSSLWVRNSCLFAPSGCTSNAFFSFETSGPAHRGRCQGGNRRDKEQEPPFLP